MQQYQERLYWHVRRLVTNHEDANDVLQNSLIKVFRNIRQFEGKSKLYTWLYRIATNEAITFLQQQQRKGTVSMEVDGRQVGSELQADPYLDGEALELRLRQALNRLPEKQRVVFTLRYYDELSYKEMSDILETSEGALKASYHHAVKKIEAFIKGEEAD